MPRYTQVAPTFTPVDYATRIAPLEQYKDEYDKRLDKIEEQGLLADAIGGLIDENTDPELMDTYRDYSNRMQQTAKDLLDSGDLRSSRQSLLELRRDYANKLVPIQQAFNTRAEAAKSFREQKAKDPTYIGTDPLEHGLKDYMNGRMPNDKVASGAALYTLGQKASSAASGREIRETAWALDRKLGNQFFTKIKQEGWSQDEVMYALENLAKSDDKSIGEDARRLIGFINDTVSNIHSINDIDSFADNKNRDASDGWILRGVIDGIGYKQEEKQQTYTPYKNEIAYYNLQEAKYKAEKARREAGGGDNNDSSSITDEESYKPSSAQSNNAEFIRRATAEFDTSLIDKETGQYARNPIEAYKIMHAFDDRKDNLKKKEKELVKKYGITGTSGNIIWRDEEKRNEYNNIQQELYSIEQRENKYRDYALTDAEYSKLQKITGIENFNIKDVIDATQNNFEYNDSPVAYNDHLFSDNSDSMKELQGRLISDVVGFATEHPDVKFAFKTDDGITPSGDGRAIRLDKKDIENIKNATKVEMNAFNLANGYIKIVTSEGKYLIPIDKLRNEAFKNAINSPAYQTEDNKYVSRKERAQELLYGRKYSKNTLKERVDSLDKDVWESIVEGARDYGYNFRTHKTGTEKNEDKAR